MEGTQFLANDIEGGGLGTIISNSGDQGYVVRIVQLPKTCATGIVVGQLITYFVTGNQIALGGLYTIGCIYPVTQNGNTVLQTILYGYPTWATCTIGTPTVQVSVTALGGYPSNATGLKIQQFSSSNPPVGSTPTYVNGSTTLATGTSSSCTIIYSSEGSAIGVELVSSNSFVP